MLNKNLEWWLGLSCLNFGGCFNRGIFQCKFMSRSSPICPDHHPLLLWFNSRNNGALTWMSFGIGDLNSRAVLTEKQMDEGTDNIAMRHWNQRNRSHFHLASASFAAMPSRKKRGPGMRGLPSDFVMPYPGWMKPMFRGGDDESEYSSASESSEFLACSLTEWIILFYYQSLIFNSDWIIPSLSQSVK